MKILFPFPSSKLSPNNHTDRRWLTKDRQFARRIGYLITKDAKLVFGKDAKLQMYILICPPDNRKRDDDNILSAFKSYRDGIFQALEMDDRCVRRTILEWGDVMKDGGLYVEFSEVS